MSVRYMIFLWTGNNIRCTPSGCLWTDFATVVCAVVRHGIFGEMTAKT